MGGVSTWSVVLVLHLHWILQGEFSPSCFGVERLNAEFTRGGTVHTPLFGVLDVRICTMGHARLVGPSCCQN